MLKIAILTIGDEICIGQVVNTNAAWLGSKCTELGCEIVAQSTIGDNKEMMLSELDRLLSIADITLITGGLGPTPDDITKPVLAEYFGATLALHEETYKNIIERYTKIGVNITERNKSMAYLPSNCKAYQNSAGSAPGMLFEKSGKYIISMPGVPKEVKTLMTEHFLPFIQKLIAENKSEISLFKTLMTINIPESYLADLIGDTETLLGGGSLAYLPSYRGVRLRIGVRGKDFGAAESEIKRIESHIREKAGKYIFAEGEDSIESVVGRLLIEKQRTVSVAESCTGGLLGASLTDTPGSSAYFVGGMLVYSNEAKISILGVRPEMIDKYGAVSEETVKEMAANVRNKFNTDYGIGVTGIAGPDGGTDDKPVGTVWIGVADEKGVLIEKFVYSSGRSANREYTVGRALGMLYKKLIE